MTNDDALLALVAAGFGYLAGKSKNASFEPIIQQFNQRLEPLRYFKIVPPFGFLNNNRNATILFREGIYCYLFGLPNSCFPILVRVLEVALKEKYQIVENKKPSSDVSLSNLIDWAEKKLDLATMTAHSYRKVRNLIHTDNLVSEQDCLEGLRHVSIILNNIFPRDWVNLHSKCNYCNRSVQSSHQIRNLFLGIELTIKCPVCQRDYKWILISI